jgi:4-carboxymuconolactone decarboxylase
MDDKERYEKGMARRRHVAGDTYVDRANANKTAFTEEFQSLLTRYAWGEIWTRPGLDERTRRVLVIGTLMALNKWEEFQMHVRSALAEGGFTADDIKEIILQQAVYCGIAAGNSAFRLANPIVQELAAT